MLAVSEKRPETIWAQLLTLTHVVWRTGIGTGQGTEAGHSLHFCLWPAQQDSLREEILAPFTGTNIPSEYKMQLQFVECP